MKTIDARGLACPAPVLQTKAVIEKEQPDILKVIIDNKASQENVSLFFASRSYSATIQQEGNDFIVIGTRTGDMPTTSETPVPCMIQQPETTQKKIMVMITSNRIGHGDDGLGEKLMTNFLKTLKEMGRDLWRLVFVNNGVKLTVEGSEVLLTLQELETKGVHILVCGTCLTHFNLLEKKKVGETTNMLDIVTAMQVADKVINL